MINNVIYNEKIIQHIFNDEINKAKHRVLKYFSKPSSEHGKEIIFAYVLCKLRTELFDLFIEIGTNINEALSLYDWRYEEICGNNDLIMKLFEHGLDPKLIVRKIPLILLLAEYGDADIMKYLIKSGAILSFDVEKVFMYSFQNHESKVMELLLDCGYKNPLTVGEMLKYSFECGRKWIFDYTFEKYGIDINYIDENGDSFMIYATKISCSPGIEKTLIKKGIDINIRNKKNKSALYYAIRRRNNDLINLLMKHGADIQEKEKELIISKYILNKIPESDYEILKKLSDEPIYGKFYEITPGLNNIYESVLYTDSIDRTTWNMFVEDSIYENCGYEAIKYFIISGIINVKEYVNHDFIRMLLSTEDIDSANLFLESGFEIKNIGKIYYDRNEIDYDSDRNRFIKI